HGDAGTVQGLVGEGVRLVPLPGAHHEHRRIHPFERTARGTVHPTVHGGRGGTAVVAMQTGRIHQYELPLREGSDAEQAVAGGLWTRGDDADLGADEGVGQGRLADVRAADDGDVAGAVGGLFHAAIVGPGGWVDA